MTDQPHDSDRGETCAKKLQPACHGGDLKRRSNGLFPRNENGSRYLRELPAINAELTRLILYHIHFPLSL
jgi:hypothetical protein